jgi:hypothetical protein
MVYLTLIAIYCDPGLDTQRHFTRPCNVKQGQTFYVLIHIDLVEDLTLYHYPPEQLTAKGKVQLREFFWSPGLLHGDMDEDDIRPIERYCRPDREHRIRPRYDDDDDGREGRCQGEERS